MQPNQQDSNQQPAQQPYSVPDYLHMDPVTGQQKKPNNRIKIVLLVFVAVVVLGVAGFAGWTWLQGAPERQFYQALDNSMQSSYVKREFSFQPRNKDTKISVIATAESDLSDLKQPKSHVTYNAYDPSLVDTTAQNSYRRGEVTAVEQHQYAGKLVATPSWDSFPRLKFNQWYNYSDPTALSALAFDREDLLPLFNTVNGLIPLGNFSSDQRQQIIDFSRNNAIYTLKSSKADTVNNQKVTDFTVSVSDAQLTSLNKKIDSLVTLKNVTNRMVPDNNKVDFWVDDSNRIVKSAWQVTKSKESWTVELTTTYTQKPNISEPSDAIPLP
ncbi:MAG: hypothetical protein JWO07_608 [Candidatus Saccharibacteria bacterium]|nr:hypothetical protein [Candidatus Saccharibacteria bacterium]